MNSLLLNRTQLPFRFDGIATDRRHQENKICLSLTEAVHGSHKPRSHFEIQCKFLSKSVIRIHGFNDDYAWARSLNFLNRIFEILDVTLTDHDENSFQFEEIDMSIWYIPDKDTRPLEYWLFEHKEIDPLRLSRRYLLEAEFIEETFQTEHRPEMREPLYDLLIECYMATQQYEKERLISHQFADEFPNNVFAWKELASRYQFAFFRQDEKPTQEDLNLSFGYYKKALSVAKKQDEWFRFITFDYCRFLKENEKWGELEQAMMAILEDLKTSSREIDMHKLEGEWIKKIPDGKISPIIIQDYLEALEWDQKRLRQKKSETDA